MTDIDKKIQREIITNQAYRAFDEALELIAQVEEVEAEGLKYALAACLSDAVADSEKVEGLYEQPSLVQSVECVDVSIDDFYSLLGADTDVELDEESKDDLVLVKSFTLQEWNEVGNIVSNWVYDGDHFDDGLREAIESIREERKNT